MPRKDRPLMDQAYEQIKRRIVTLELRPGERIDDYRLSERLGLSRTPTREALFALSAEGLISTGGRSGFVVRTLDIVDVAELFEAHVVVAKAIARLAAQRATAADLRAMERAARDVEKAIERRDYLRITRANANLHRLEAAAAHSRHLHGMACSVHDQGQRLAYLCFGGNGRSWPGLEDHFALVKEQHAALLSAYAAHDADAAQTVAMEHVRTFRQRVQAYLASPALDQLSISDEELATGREP